MARKPKSPVATTASAPARFTRRCVANDAAFLAALRRAADEMVALGSPEPGLACFVRCAADELERFHAADLIPDRRPGMEAVP